MSKHLEQIARRIEASVPKQKNQWARSALVPWKIVNELRAELARIDAERAKRNAGVPAVAQSAESLYRGQCQDGVRCLNGCHKTEPCWHEQQQVKRTRGVPASSTPSAGEPSQ